MGKGGYLSVLRCVGNPLTVTRGIIIVKHHQRTDCPGRREVGGGIHSQRRGGGGGIIVKDHQRADCPGGGGGSRGEGRY